MNRPRIAFVLLGQLLLAACGSGGAGSESDAGGAGIVAQGASTDPAVIDVPVAYIRREAGVDGTFPVFDMRDPVQFVPGAALYVIDRASPEASRINVTDRAFEDADGFVAPYDVRDLTVSADGGTLLFAMRAPEPEDPAAPVPTWNLWTYEVASDSLQRVFASDVQAEAGDDRFPAFLPDGRIVFASTRQQRSRAILLDEGKPQYAHLEESGRGPAMSLHRVNADGSDLEQISFNPSHDIYPAVLQDGTLAYVRWDRAPGHDGFNLYRLLPDGRANELLYGFHSHDATALGPVEFSAPRELPDGRLLVRLQARQPAALGAGELIVVDPSAFVDLGVPVSTNAGGVEPDFKRIVPREVRLDDLPSLGGRYLGAWPLFDGTGRLLVSWSPCRAVRVDGSFGPCIGVPLDQTVEAPPAYGIWVYDPASDTQQPVLIPESGVAFTEPVALAPSGNPAVLVDGAAAGELDADLLAADVGAIDIRSVYDIGGEDTSGLGIAALADPGSSNVTDRPVVFLRLIKQAPLPPREVIEVPGFAFGPRRSLGMREVLGYATVHPDGSVLTAVPADVPFSLELVDAQGARVHVHRQYWLDVRPGEVLRCNGCHLAGDTTPHGRPEIGPASINPGGPFPGVTAELSGTSGETLAQAYADRHGVPLPSLDVEFQDLWTDPAVRPADPPFAYRYRDLSTPLPFSDVCLAQWSARCRALIHFPVHIAPLFDLPRTVLDTDGVTVLEDHTCTACHAPVNADGLAMVPAAQLDLSPSPSDANPDQLTSYRELLFSDNEQEVIDGVLVDRLVQATDGAGTPLFETDEFGQQILDAAGNPIPVLVPVRLAPPASAAGARASGRLFAPFGPGGSHAGYLSDAELRLLREWLDLGAQYYNDPFAVGAGS